MSGREWSSTTDKKGLYLCVKTSDYENYMYLNKQNVTIEVEHCSCKQIHGYLKTQVTSRIRLYNTKITFIEDLISLSQC